MAGLAQTSTDTLILLVTGILQAWTARELRQLRIEASDRDEDDR